MCLCLGHYSLQAVSVSVWLIPVHGRRHLPTLRFVTVFHICADIGGSSFLRMWIDGIRQRLWYHFIKIGNPPALSLSTIECQLHCTITATLHAVLKLVLECDDIGVISPSVKLSIGIPSSTPINQMDREVYLAKFPGCHRLSRGWVCSYVWITRVLSLKWRKEFHFAYRNVYLTCLLWIESFS